ARPLAAPELPPYHGRAITLPARTMLLNVIWAGFILVAVVSAFVQTVVFGNADILPALVRAMFDTARTGFEIALGLTGVMTLWLGIMKIGERAGLIALMARGLAPLFRRLFPGV
ncbi:MAG: hypothetical protein ACN6N0_05000, partial [Microvirgula sp.]